MRPVSMHVRNSLTRVFLFSAAALLSACGTDGANKANEPQVPATHAISAEIAVGSQPDALSALAVPSFHVAPVITNEPDATDVAEPSASALRTPRSQAIPAELSMLSTRRLTRHVMDSVIASGQVPAESQVDPNDASAASTVATATVYTPAQIRAAYAQTPLPAPSASLTSAQAAQFGAGQTIYLIDAQHDPNVAAELATFNSKFGLPACKTVAIATNATLPLSAAPTSGCTFSVVYSTMAVGMTATAPAYDADWATEIALDVQWAHATAPYARIILIEAANSSIGSLATAVELANTMGPGIVSQSFGAAEGSWAASLDSIYQVANMTYVAAAGDLGYAVNWPADSANVLAVGGTSLTYPGASGATRTESAWSGTGAGISAYIPSPSYQSYAVQGLSTHATRAVTDVAFNADPYTGQYVAQIPQGSTTPEWSTVGGTSMAAPQWAGVLAVANAVRALNENSSVGLSQPLLYKIGEQSSSYFASFKDVSSGSDGSCSGCYAEGGYDLPTGLGTPNVTSLVAALSATTPAPAPIIAAASVTGQSFSPLTFTVSATAPDAVTYSLLSAPSGMSISSSTGVVSWPSPLVGTYAIVVKALDPKTQESGQGTITATIIAPAPPVVTGGAISGTALTALNFPVQAVETNAVTWSLSGAPAGMLVSSAGVVSWASPVTGSYTVSVTATDNVTHESGKGTFTVSITPPLAPTVTAKSVTAYTGSPLSFQVATVASNPLTYALTSAPAGLVISASGVITWSVPVAGSYTILVTVTDTKTHLMGKANVVVVIGKAGPTLAAAATVAGTKGKALSASISVNDSSSSSVTLSASGLPSGMTFATSSCVLTLHWAAPVAGTYPIVISARDAQGLSTSTTMMVSIAN